MAKNLRALVVGVLLGTLFLAAPLAQSEYIRQIAGGVLFGTGNANAVLFGNDGKGYIKVAVGGAVTLINGATIALPAITASTCAAPSLALTGAATTGIAFASTPSIFHCIAGAVQLSVNATGVGIGTDAPGRILQVGSDAVGGYMEIAGATADPVGVEFSGAGTADWLIYRTGAGENLSVFDYGENLDRLTFIDGTGEVRLGTNGSFGVATKAWVRTAPTVAAGFCTSPAIAASNGTAAFAVTIGTGCAGSTGSVTLPTATTAWVCTGFNVTAPATNVIGQTGGTTTTATFTNYARTTGLAANWTDSDSIRFQCTGY